jgi:hypothetical protein
MLNFDSINMLCIQGTVYEDVEAAKWYEGGHKSTTNEARNSDVQDFWQSCKGNAAGAIKDLTGEQRQQFCEFSVVCRALHSSWWQNAVHNSTIA